MSTNQCVVLDVHRAFAAKVCHIFFDHKMVRKVIAKAHFGYLYFFRLAAFRWSSGMLQEAHRCRSCRPIMTTGPYKAGKAPNGAMLTCRFSVLGRRQDLVCARA